MNNYPVGATWKAEDKKTGNRYMIWLDRRDGKYEMWYWSWCYSDGSSPIGSFDWASSYRSARETIPAPLKMRFKRVK